MKTTDRILRSGRRVKVEVAPPAPAVTLEEKRKPYRKVDEHYIFGPGGDTYYRPLPPEPIPPEGDDILSLDKIPLNEIEELLQDFPRGKRNAAGVMFPGGFIKVRLKGGTFLSGWLNQVDLALFRKEGAFRGWRPTHRQ